MPTTLQQVVATVRAANLVPASHCNFGFADNLSVPYIAVKDYQAEYTYQTCGIAIRTSKFTVMVVHKSLEAAEAIAFQIDALLNLSTTLTDKAMRCFQESYKVGQLEMGGGSPLYQFGCEAVYTLTENM